MDKNNYNEKIINFPSDKEKQNTKQGISGKLLFKCIGYILFVSFLIMIIFLVNGDTTFDSTNAVNEETINLSVANNFDFASYRDGYILAKDGFVSAFNTNQELQWEIKGSKTAPIVKTNGKYCLTYYNDDKLALITNGDKTQKIKTTGDVQYGYVNKNGYSVLFIKEVGLKNKIAVYDRYGDMLYYMDNPDKYISSAILSDNNRTLVTTEIFPKSQNVSTTVHIIDIRANKEKKKIVFENLVSGGCYFKNKNEFITFFSSKIVCNNISGREKWTVDFDGKQPVKYAYNGKNVIGLVFDVITDTGSASQAVFYNTNGKQIGTYDSNEKINSIDIHEKTVLLGLDRKLRIINTKGRELSSADVSYDIKDIIFMQTKKCALVLSSSSEARIVMPK